MKFLKGALVALALACAATPVLAQTGAPTVGVYRATGGSSKLPAQGTQPIPAANMAPFQATVTTSPTLLAAARDARQYVTVVNGGSAAIFLGGSSVTSSTGVSIPAGGSITIAFIGDLYAVTASGTDAVTGYELY